MRWLLFAVLVAPVLAQNCKHYDTPATLRGQLVHVDQGGYRDYFLLKVDSPVCTIAVPELEIEADQPASKVQVWVANGRTDVWNRLQALNKQRVSVTGTLNEPGMNPHAQIAIDAERIEPLDAEGVQAIRAFRPLTPRDVPLYRAVIRTGPRLKIEVYEGSSRTILKPASDYVRYLMTNGDTLSVDCREGYALRAGEFVPQGAGDCSQAGCTFPNPLQQSATLSIRCEKRP
jgi:hypothetical protein